MRNIHRRFDLYYIGQIYGGDFANFFDLLKIYELYLTNSINFKAKFQTLMRAYVVQGEIGVLFRPWKEHAKHFSSPQLKN